jgi:hypothetical protein
MKALTIRNLPPALAEALDREKHRRGQSLNQTVIDLLRFRARPRRSRPSTKSSGVEHLLSRYVRLQQLPPWKQGGGRAPGPSRAGGGPTIALGELRTGFLLGARRHRDESELDAFLAKVLTCDERFERIGRVGSVVVGV